MDQTNQPAATPAQASLLRYWRRQAGGREAPSRADIDPCALRRYLGSLSLVERGADGSYAFRIAGSGLKDLLGADATGRGLRDLSLPRQSDWLASFDAALESRAPVYGATRLPEATHAWIRLPLADASTGELTLIMCHDDLIGHNQEASFSAERRFIPMQRSLIAA